MENKGKNKKIRNIFSLKRMYLNNPGPDERLMLVGNQQKELKKADDVWKGREGGYKDLSCLVNSKLTLNINEVKHSIDRKFIFIKKLMDKNLLLQELYRNQF